MVFPPETGKVVLFFVIQKTINFCSENILKNVFLHTFYETKTETNFLLLNRLRRFPSFNLTTPPFTVLIQIPPPFKKSVDKRQAF